MRRLAALEVMTRSSTLNNIQCGFAIKSSLNQTERI